jgi:hypothetical protein
MKKILSILACMLIAATIYAGTTPNFNWNYGVQGQSPWWTTWETLWQAVDAELYPLKLKLLGYDDARRYASINAAVAALGATETTLDVTNGQTLTADLTIPATLRLRSHKGGIITLGDYNLQINGPFDAGWHKTFNQNGAGRVSFGAGSVKEIHAEWWEENASPGTTAMTAAFASAVESISEGRIQLGRTTYNANIVISGKNNIALEGTGWSSHVIPASGVGITITNSPTTWVRSLAVSAAGKAVSVSGAGNALFDKLWLESSADDALYIDGDQPTEITISNSKLYPGTDHTGLHYVRTTATDTGGIYLSKVWSMPANGTTGKRGFVFEGSTPVNVFAILESVMADGFAEPAYSFVNVGNITGSNVWGAINAASKGVVLIDNSSLINLTASRLANSSATGRILHIKNSSYNVNLPGLQVFGADGNTIVFFETFAGHSIRLPDSHITLGAYTFTNSFASFVNAQYNYSPPAAIMTHPTSANGYDTFSIFDTINQVHRYARNVNGTIDFLNAGFDTVVQQFENDGDIKLPAAGARLILKNSAGTVTKALKLNDAGDALELVAE